jgi:hypothetical protein
MFWPKRLGMAPCSPSMAMRSPPGATASTFSNTLEDEAEERHMGVHWEPSRPRASFQSSAIEV